MTAFEPQLTAGTDESTKLCMLSIILSDRACMTSMPEVQARGRRHHILSHPGSLPLRRAFRTSLDEVRSHLK